MSAIAPPPAAQSQYGDDPIEVLFRWSVLAGYFNSGVTYLYDSTTNTWSAGRTKLENDASDEESWMKLPDGSILSYNIFSSISDETFKAQRYIPTLNQWVDASNLDSNNPPGLLSTAVRDTSSGPASCCLTAGYSCLGPMAIPRITHRPPTYGQPGRPNPRSRSKV